MDARLPEKVTSNLAVGRLIAAKAKQKARIRATASFRPSFVKDQKNGWAKASFVLKPCPQHLGV